MNPEITVNDRGRARIADDGLAFACPECDTAGTIYERTTESIVERQGGVYRCGYCGAVFDDGVVREPKTSRANAGGKIGLSEGGQQLVDMDPDVDLRELSGGGSA